MKKLTDDEIAWTAYSSIPPIDHQRLSSIEEMSQTVKAVWLRIGKNYLANGIWPPPKPEREVDYTELSREHLARYPKIRAKLAES